MFQVETVNLLDKGVRFPSAGVGMVLAQPHLELSPNEPYVCLPDARLRQLKMVDDTFDVAIKATHGAGKTHFTVFPECSIPGLEGISLIEQRLRQENWPCGTVVIAGIDALTKAEALQIAAEPGTHNNAAHSNYANMLDHEWLNCCITWVKREDGEVERWLQPKIVPAWVERNVRHHSMFRGGSVYLFTGPFDDLTSFRFFSLVCFDWIGALNGQKVWREILSSLSDEATAVGLDMPLSWVFVVQSNDSPSHATFLAEIVGFFDQTVFPNVRRDRTCLVMANSAGSGSPGVVEDYGDTALVFSPQTLFAKSGCLPTFSNGGTRFRKSPQLLPYKDFLFREGGACIHSFFQINPGSLQIGAAGKSLAIERPFVYPLSEKPDPRIPSSHVPACVKWLNDRLDELPGLGHAYAQVPLAGNILISHATTVGSMRAVPATAAERAIRLASSPCGTTADEWDSCEREALEHLVDTVDILETAQVNPVVNCNPAHASISMAGKSVDVLAVRGISHEACAEYVKDHLSITRKPLVLISRDKDNNHWNNKRFGSILETGKLELAQERKITDPLASVHHIGYRALLDVFQGSASVEIANGAVNAAIGA